MEDKAFSDFESLQTKILSLCAAKNPDQISVFLIEMTKLLNQPPFQLSLYQNFSNYKDLFLKFFLFLLNEFPSQYITLESLIFSWISHPCLIISNFALFYLILISMYLPISRVLQICEYFCIECLNFSGFPVQYLRYLSLCSDLKSTITYFLKEKKNEFIYLLAVFSETDENLFDFVKQNLTLDAPSELHYALIRFSNDKSNILNCFKNLASRLWVMQNTQKLRKIDCLCLIEYSSLPCVGKNIEDLEILKSVIFALNAVLEILNRPNEDSEISHFHFETSAKICIGKIKNFQVPEKFEKKFRENWEKVEKKIQETKFENLGSVDLIEEGKKLCKNKLEIIDPIQDLQKILGIKSKLNTENDFFSAVEALEEITLHLKASLNR